MGRKILNVGGDWVDIDIHGFPFFITQVQTLSQATNEYGLVEVHIEGPGDESTGGWKYQRVRRRGFGVTPPLCGEITTVLGVTPPDGKGPAREELEVIVQDTVGRGVTTGCDLKRADRELDGRPIVFQEFDGERGQADVEMVTSGPNPFITAFAIARSRGGHPNTEYVLRIWVGVEEELIVVGHISEVSFEALLTHKIV
jgi:hypothetical protein